MRECGGCSKSLGYSPEVATTLSLLCTELPTTEVLLDGTTWHVARGERVLPQGSPASPALTNILCWGLDHRLAGLAAKLGFAYTRYADDLTFSHMADDAHVGTLLKAVAQIVEEEGFSLHPNKTRVMRAGSRQEVTGLVVNDGLSVSRHLRRQWKAAMFRLERDGLESVDFGHGADKIASLVGFASFVAMVTPEVGAPMITRSRAAAEAVGWRQTGRKPAPKTAWKQAREQAMASRAAELAKAEALLAGASSEPAAATPAGGTGAQGAPTSPAAGEAHRSSGDESGEAQAPAKWWEFWRWFE